MKRPSRRRWISPRVAVPLVAALAAGGIAAVVPQAEAATSVAVKATADSYVDTANPTVNYGKQYVLRAQANADGSALQTSYLQFTVSGVTQQVSSATLQLYTYSSAVQGLQVRTATNNWTETGITAENAPTPSSTMVGAIPSIKSNTSATLDVSNVVTGNGTYTFVISTTAPTNKQFASRESTTGAPQLMLQVGSAAATVSAASGDGQSATTGTAFARPFAAQVTDASGAGVANVPVTFTAPSSGASGTFAGGSTGVSVTTGPDGVATAPTFTANNQAGSYNVTATTTGVSAPATFAVTNQDAAPSTSTATSTSNAPPSTSSSAPSTSSAAPSTTSAAPSSVPPSASSSAASSPAPSSSPPATGSTTTTTFKLASDTYVRSDQPDTNFGAKYNIAAEGGSASTPTVTSYLTVKVSGLTGPVVSSSLQLYSYSTSPLGVDVWSTDPNWSESTITYNNAPALGPAAGSGRNILLNTVASIDLGSSITGNGTYSFAVTTTRTALDTFGSRESTTPESVVVTTGSGSPGPNPSPTTSSAAPSSSSSASATSSASSPSGVTLAVAGGAQQSAMIGGTFASPLSVTATNGGTPAAGVPVTFTAPSTNASATFPGGASSVTITTDDTGTATSPPVTANNTAGSYSITASATGAAQSATFALTNTAPTIVAAGDIACQQGSAPTATSCQQMATSNLAISLKPDYVLPLGDDQYELGSLSDYQAMYDPSWGRLNSIAYPVPGNHEYGYIGTAVEPTGGQGYFTYFGDRSHPLQPGCTISCTSWYSYNIGSWHIVALDSQCSVIGGCNPGNPEYNWLQADLKANPAKCTLAYWHIPLFSSSQDHQPDMQSIYNLLYTKGADVVLNGHAHFYERFGPQDASGNATPTGPREFIVGSGGRNFFAIRATPAANSEARIANTFGVLQMTLGSDSYSWRFVPGAGGTATDSGSAACV